MQNVVTRQNQMDTKISAIGGSVSVLTGGWKFQGFELGASADDYVWTYASLHDCLDFCSKKRNEDRSWNGMSWRPASKACYCHKNDQGHDKTSVDYLHFKASW